jgi:hypothetical protein
MSLSFRLQTLAEVSELDRTFSLVGELEAIWFESSGRR